MTQKITYGTVYKISLKKIKVVPNGGESLTQPDMALPMSKLMERSKLGMQLQGFEPIFYGDKHKELVNFEMMTKQEKLDFVRKFKKTAQDQVETLQADKLKQLKDKQLQEMSDKDKMIAELKSSLENLQKP